MSTSLKRNSSIVYVQEKRIKNYNIEELVVSCSVNTIIEIVESFSIEWCNECHCKFAEKVDIVYDDVIIRLEKEIPALSRNLRKV